MGGLLEVGKVKADALTAAIVLWLAFLWHSLLLAYLVIYAANQTSSFLLDLDHLKKNRTPRPWSSVFLLPRVVGPRSSFSPLFLLFLFIFLYFCIFVFYGFIFL